jgi:hypothetical protein
MQFQSFEPNIEVKGQSVYAVVGAFVALRHVVTGVLVDEGIGSFDETGAYRADRDVWYPQDAWLRAFARVAATMPTFHPGSPTFAARSVRSTSPITSTTARTGW